MNPNRDERKLYQKFVAGQSVALFSGENDNWFYNFVSVTIQFENVGLLGNCDSFSFLTYPMPWMSIDVLGIHQQGEVKCPKGYCLHYGWSSNKCWICMYILTVILNLQL